jgi:hypothetical protein
MTKKDAEKYLINRGYISKSDYNYNDVLRAMVGFAQQQVKNLNIPAVVGRSEQLLPKSCKICKTEIRIDVGDGLCAECWSRQ